MPLPTKLLRAQVSALKPFMENCSIETIRKTHTMTGHVMAAPRRAMARYAPQTFPDFDAAWVTPKERELNGVILYLHGGGYVAGNLEYAKGYGTTLAFRNQIRVFCVAYRLAPEYPYPAALEDALTAYRYLLGLGYPPEHIILCGESAGGGLCYALVHKLRALHLPLPGGVIGISPWTDLTCSGKFYEVNKDADPSMTKERLQHYAALYTVEGGDLRAPFLSPLFGDVSGFPPSLIFAGGDEVMLADAVRMNEKLVQAGCASQLIIAPGLWHVYPLYALQESREATADIIRFIRGILRGDTV